MGTRGPQKGFKQARLAKLAQTEGAATPLSSISPAETEPTVAVTPPVEPPVTPPVARARRAPVVELSAQDRENPAKLSGAPLKVLAHKYGLAKSDIATMSEAKLREQMHRYQRRRQDELQAEAA
jgi:hypothetical protein